VRGEDRRRAATRDHGHRDAGALEHLERALEEHARAGLAIGKRHEPLEAEIGQAHGGPRQLQGRLGRLHAVAAEARVALDEERHLDAGRARALRDPARHHVVVEHDREPAQPPRQRDEPLDLGAPDDVEREQHVIRDAGVGEDLDLAKLLARDADGAGGHLQAAERRNLVGLHVRPIGDAVTRQVVVHAPDVALDDVEPDGHGGCVELGHAGHRME
jgi:hypothetical protein